MKTIGVILCGSGFKDGSEVRESVGVLWALSQHSVKVRCFAADDAQTDVVNCLTGEPMKETRNMLIESARIARGHIEALSQMKTQELDAVIIPGGFGAAKNLCDFAFKGSEGKVRADVQQILEQMHAQKKPIGAVCIAPAIVALALKGKGVSLTLGAASETAQEIEKLGQKHVVCLPQNCVVDEAHLVVSSPAYMYDDAPLHQIFEGIGKLVNETVRLIR